MNQMKAVLDHLKTKGSITSMEAFELYGCTRLSDKILRLRDKGYDISTIMIESVNRYGDLCRYGKYVIKEAE